MRQSKYQYQDPQPVIRLVRKEGRRPAILLGLRDNENDFGVIKVWARKLRVATPSLTIPVSSSITTEQVIGEALARFRLEGEPVDKYQLVKVTLESGRVTESVLNNDDIPWEVLKRRGFESVRLMELTRFYLQLKEDPHGPNVALFVGNLPPNLNQKQYETILLEYLDDGKSGLWSPQNIKQSNSNNIRLFKKRAPFKMTDTKKSNSINPPQFIHEITTNERHRHSN